MQDLQTKIAFVARKILFMERDVASVKSDLKMF